MGNYIFLPQVEKQIFEGAFLVVSTNFWSMKMLMKINEIWMEVGSYMVEAFFLNFFEVPT